MVDALNTASRIESFTKCYSRPFLISGATKDALRNRRGLNIEYVDRVAPRGKAQVIALYSVRRETDGLAR